MDNDDDKDVWARNDQGRNNVERFPKQLNVVQEKKIFSGKEKSSEQNVLFP